MYVLYIYISISVSYLYLYLCLISISLSLSHIYISISLSIYLSPYLSIYCIYICISSLILCCSRWFTPMHPCDRSSFDRGYSNRLVELAIHMKKVDGWSARPNSRGKWGWNTPNREFFSKNSASKVAIGGFVMDFWWWILVSLAVHPVCDGDICSGKNGEPLPALASSISGGVFRVLRWNPNFLLAST